MTSTRPYLVLKVTKKKKKKKKKKLRQKKNCQVKINVALGEYITIFYWISIKLPLKTFPVDKFYYKTSQAGNAIVNNISPIIVLIKHLSGTIILNVPTRKQEYH